tara:strand:- start:320 stop:1087 length:768 start_codon:yes stop_codon:yes gene_type:complete
MGYEITQENKMETETHWLVQRNYEAPRLVKICPVNWQDERDVEWMRDNNLTVRSSNDPFVKGINTEIATWEEVQNKTNFGKDDIERPYCHYCNELATHRVDIKVGMVDVCKAHAKKIKDDTDYEVHTQLALFRRYSKALNSYWRWDTVPTVWEGLMEFYKEWDYNNTSCTCGHSDGRCYAHPNTAKAMKRGTDKARTRANEATEKISHDLMFDPRYINRLPLNEEYTDSVWNGAYQTPEERIEKMGNYYKEVVTN